MLNVAQTVQHHRFGSTSDAAAATPAGPAEQPDFVCVSAALRRLLLQAEITGSRLRLASIEGEAGAGKHLLAQTIHARSPLARLSFCRRDAREWLAMEADTASLSGTLYLDRVDLLAPTGQNLLLSLLKVLQNMETSGAPTRFLLLVSAHTPLRQLASQGHFLPDLAFRLTAVRFALPPLREHREDIGPITQALIERICRRYQQPTAVLAPGALPRLLQHAWPGNVRELSNLMERLVIYHAGKDVTVADLALPAPVAPPVSRDPGASGGYPQQSAHPSSRPSAPPPPSAQTGAGGSHHTPADGVPIVLQVPEAGTTFDDLEREILVQVLSRADGNQSKAARSLGLSESTLRSRLKRLGLKD